MRIIWAVIALVLIGAIGTWLVGDRPPRGDVGPQSPTPEPELTVVQAPATSDDSPRPEVPVVPEQPAPAPIEATIDDEAIAQILAGETSPLSPDAQAAEAELQPPAPGAAPTEQAPLDEAADSPAPEDPPVFEAAPEEPVAPPALSPEAAIPLPAGDPTSPPHAEADAPPTLFAGQAPIPGKVEKRADGTILLDDRFILKGEGTKESPFLLTWDHLVSAMETYQPRQGKKQLPERVTMLHDRWVEISGNVSYPLLEEEPRELLMMLNPWDGCCLGVPPTPYDAVEVKLTAVVRDDRKFATTGSVRGKLKVDPYLAGEWLIGLYVMEGAELTVGPGAGTGF